jgi:hypothetical protein
VPPEILNARAFELSSLASMRGSALSCLGADNTNETSCEKTLFATPESTASAISYVAAQIRLLADGTAFAHREPSYLPTLSHLRRSIESDRFGLVAQALSVRAGCTPDHCAAFALLNETAGALAVPRTTTSDPAEAAAFYAGTGRFTKGLQLLESMPDRPSNNNGGLERALSLGLYQQRFGDAAAAEQLLGDAFRLRLIALADLLVQFLQPFGIPQKFLKTTEPEPSCVT